MDHFLTRVSLVTITLSTDKSEGSPWGHSLEISLAEVQLTHPPLSTM